MSAVDWSICAGYLAVVFAQGWWFANRQHTKEDYLVGGRRMSWLAVGISLFAASFSSLSFVGLPREAAYGDYHLYLAILFIPLVVNPLVGWLFVPMFQRLRLTSAYEYLERRFHRSLQLLGSLLYCLYTVGWMGSMLYALCLVLQAALDLSDAQLLWTMIGVGLFTTIYTSAGGFQAVIWTDVLQAVVLAGTVLAVLVLAAARVEGGWAGIWQLGIEHDKFQMFDLRFDLHRRANFYAACAYGMFVYLAAHSVGQGCVQRYVSLPSVSAAWWSLLVNGLLTAGVCLLFFLLGTTLFAFYQSSAPAAPPDNIFPALAKQDQLTTYFIRSELSYPGLMGLLLAGLLAAAMGCISSGINSLTALVVCDWLPGHTLSVGQSRWLCGGLGVATIITALLVPYLGEHVFDILITIAGAFFGPLLGLFLLGMFVRRANAAGALAGLAAGVVSLGLIVALKISPWWYGAFTCVPTVVVGMLISLLFPPPSDQRIRGLVVSWGGDRRPAYESLEVQTYSRTLP